MNAFQLTYRHNHKNLHINLQGCFDPYAAQQLVDTILAQYVPSGKIFINTRELRSLSSAGLNRLKTSFASTTMTPSALYFKGEHAFAMAPSGCRVLVMAKQTEKKKSHQCCGKCVTCTCGGRCGGKHKHAHD